MNTTTGISEKQSISRDEQRVFDNHYALNLDCSNCDYWGKTYIEKGFMLSQVLCPNCECPDTLEIRK